MSPYKGIIFSDFDGTLIDSKGRLPEANRRCLQELKQEGFLRVIATGRNLYSFRKAVREMDLAFDYLIFSTGAGILDWGRNQLLRRSHFTAEEARPMADILSQNKADFMIHRAVPDNHCFYYQKTRAENSDFEARFRLYAPFAAPYQPPLSEPVTQFLAILPPGRHHTTVWNGNAPACEVIRTTSPLDGESLWLELFPAGVNKAGGARWLCRHLGLTDLPLMSVGNDYNDLDLLRWTADSYVVANAPADLKEEFAVVPLHTDAGFNSAVRHWRSQYSI